MKLETIEEITIKTAHRERTRCARCYNRMYEIHRVIYPYDGNQWYIKCGICGNSTDDYWFKRNAIKAWKEENNVNYVYCP